MKLAIVLVFAAGCSAVTLPRRGPTGTCKSSSIPIGLDVTVSIAATLTTLAMPSACEGFDTDCAAMTITSSTVARSS